MENQKENKQKWRNGSRRILKTVFLLILLAAAVSVSIWAAKQIRSKNAIAERGEVSIVVLGDSIWDLVRDDTGIAARLSDKLGAKVYNLAISGTSAAFRREGEELEKWNGETLCRLVEQITGRGEACIEETEEAFSLIQEIDYEKIDYFIIAYGLNDYFEAIPTQGPDDMDSYTYAGALRNAVSMLKEAYPQAKIVLISQTYCQGYSYGKIASDSDTKDYGSGVGPDYVAVAEKVAEEYGAIFINNYERMGINRRNGPKYLSDATHLTEKGRDKYAGIVADCLIADYLQ